MCVYGGQLTIQSMRRVLKQISPAGQLTACSAVRHPGSNHPPRRHGRLLHHRSPQTKRDRESCVPGSCSTLAEAFILNAAGVSEEEAIQDFKGVRAAKRKWPEKRRTQPGTRPGTALSLIPGPLVPSPCTPGAVNPSNLNNLP